VSPSTYAKALVVDDDPLQRAIASAALRSSGVERITVAHDGAEALEFLRQGADDRQAAPTFDLLLTDLQMPNMDGMAFLRGLAECGYAGAVIVVSSVAPSLRDLAGDLGRGHGLDVLGALGKPLDAKSLTGLLARPRRATAAAPTSEAPLDEKTADELALALAKGEIVPFFQPKLRIREGTVAGAEALVRWLHPSEGILPPARFIGVAEREGLIADLTWSVIDAATAEVARIRRMLPEFNVAVNISADLLNDTGLPNRIEAALARSGIDPSALVLEITESQLLAGNAAALETMGRLRLLGVELSMDDFGTGYSNLETLRKFPFNELKIDRQFVADAESNERSRAIIQSCLVLRRELQLRLVAEGIETPGQLAHMGRLGIDRAQGFMIAKPLAAAELRSWIAARVMSAA
jgi:EAL domain-containing protein (putative c-di-GMP-specific phosphodiesterase class I)/AmiR/NasT family two-component response regulator